MFLPQEKRKKEKREKVCNGQFLFDHNSFFFQEKVCLSDISLQAPH